MQRIVKKIINIIKLYIRPNRAQRVLRNLFHFFISSLYKSQRVGININNFGFFGLGSICNRFYRYIIKLFSSEEKESGFKDAEQYLDEELQPVQDEVQVQEVRETEIWVGAIKDESESDSEEEDAADVENSIMEERSLEGDAYVLEEEKIPVSVEELPIQLELKRMKQNYLLESTPMKCDFSFSEEKRIRNYWQSPEGSVELFRKLEIKKFVFPRVHELNSTTKLQKENLNFSKVEIKECLLDPKTVVQEYEVRLRIQRILIDNMARTDRERAIKQNPDNNYSVIDTTPPDLVDIIIDPVGDVYLIDQYNIDWLKITQCWDVVVYRAPLIYLLSYSIILSLPILVELLFRLYFICTNIYLWWRNNRKK